MKAVTPYGIHDEFALVYEVDLATLEKIKSNPYYYLDEDLIARATNMTGDHAVVTMMHIGFAELDEKNRKIIVAKIKNLLLKYHTVSWYNRGHKKFYTRKRRSSHADSCV